MINFKSSALILVDIQNDFLPKGALAVPEGDQIIEPVNHLLTLPFQAVVATQDWHPSDHCSFVAQGGLWPPHCVADTPGAAVSNRVNAAAITHIVRKGIRRERDSYSGFLENDHTTPTGLNGLLRDLGITQVVICGLALDYCVRATALDAVSCGYNTVLVPQACRGISSDRTITLNEFENQGVALLNTTDLQD